MPARVDRATSTAYKIEVSGHQRAQAPKFILLQSRPGLVILILPLKCL